PRSTRGHREATTGCAEAPTHAPRHDPAISSPVGMRDENNVRNRAHCATTRPSSSRTSARTTWPRTRSRTWWRTRRAASGRRPPPFDDARTAGERDGRARPAGGSTSRSSAGSRDGRAKTESGGVSDAARDRPSSSDRAHMAAVNAFRHPQLRRRVATRGRRGLLHHPAGKDLDRVLALRRIDLEVQRAEELVDGALDAEDALVEDAVRIVVTRDEAARADRVVPEVQVFEHRVVIVACVDVDKVQRVILDLLCAFG